MRIPGRILFSFIFLFAFLIPTVGETLHQLSHANDFHCNEKSVHHFHEEEHHCVLCDFSFNNYYSDLSIPELKAVHFEIAAFQFEIKSDFYSEQFFTLALRGPPVC